MAAKDELTLYGIAQSRDRYSAIFFYSLVNSDSTVVDALDAEEQHGT